MLSPQKPTTSASSNSIPSSPSSLRRPSPDSASLARATEEAKKSESSDVTVAAISNPPVTAGNLDGSHNLSGSDGPLDGGEFKEQKRGRKEKNKRVPGASADSSPQVPRSHSKGKDSISGRTKNTAAANGNGVGGEKQGKTRTRTNSTSRSFKEGEARDWRADREAKYLGRKQEREEANSHYHGRKGSYGTSPSSFGASPSTSCMSVSVLYIF